MTTTVDSPVRSTPWHFWVVAVLSLLWNGFGAYDYLMSHLQGATYYRQVGMTDAQIAWMNSFPTWMHAVWAVGVWGSALGAVLLFLRSRWATHAFAISLLGALGNMAYGATSGGTKQTMELVMPLVICGICAFLIWYSWTMTKRGLLR